uniref:hypothetical protein n=1 Tax=Mariniflexile sp. TaxID=1979402 RepID=UPI00404823AC
MEKIILNFDKNQFEWDKTYYNEKNALINKIKAVAKTLNIDIEVSNSSTLKENIFKAIELKYKEQNTLNLRGERLAELMELDINPIIEAARLLHEYDNTDADLEPVKEHYIITVDTDEELERYNHAMKCIEVITENVKRNEKVVALYEYGSAFRQVIRPNALNNGFEPLPAFVKG